MTRPRSALQDQLHEIIFGYETPAGKAFDLVLICAILLSILVVILDSVAAISQAIPGWLNALEWLFTLAFTIEYALRLYCSPQPRRYATSFYGIVDLLSILPTYLSLLVPASQALLTIRALRVLRVFRILKLVQFTGEAGILSKALAASRYKIGVFLTVVLANVTIVGSVMYLLEGPANGFTSIPVSIYWAIVTITTVGYGDISPHTTLGQALASLLMIIGYGIIAVPTGIVTVELNRASRERAQARSCQRCGCQEHAGDARYCKICGERLG